MVSCAERGGFGCFAMDVAAGRGGRWVPAGAAAPVQVLGKPRLGLESSNQRDLTAALDTLVECQLEGAWLGGDNTSRGFPGLSL